MDGRWGVHAAALLLCLLAAASLAAAGQEPRLDAPERVGVGQPFFARVFSTEPLRAVTVEWQGKTVRPAVLPVPGRHGPGSIQGWEAAALLGLGLDATADAHPLRVTVETADGERVFQRTVQGEEVAYPEQHLDVSRTYVHLSEEDLARHYREKDRVRGALDTLTPLRFWRCPLQRPVPGELSSAFGLRRFFNGEPRKPHSGLDMRGKAGTPVRACAGGEVLLTGEHFFSGNVVYIDHGQGVVSMYMHLSAIEVEEGRPVEAGDVIGRVGATGRVTGPHLHFGLSVLGEMVDPTPLLDGKCPEG